MRGCILGSGCRDGVRRRRGRSRGLRGGCVAFLACRNRRGPGEGGMRFMRRGGGYNAGRVGGGVNGREKGDAIALGIRNGGEMSRIDGMHDVFSMERAEMQGVQMSFLCFRRQKHD